MQIQIFNNRRVRYSLAVSLLALVFLSGVENTTARSKAPNPTTMRGARCLQLVDHRQYAPISLKGKLAVTFVEQSIDEESQGDPHEIGVFDLTKPEIPVRRLTNNLVNEAEVDISPDGKKLVYTLRPKLDGFEHNSEFWEMNMDGSNPVKLLSGKPYAGPTYFQPDGKKLLFTEISMSEEEGHKLYILDGTTKAVTKFPTNLENIGDPEISYDGRLVVFKMAIETDRDYQPSLYVMNADGSNVRRLTTGYSDHDAVFSRDNKKLYFERYYGPGDWFEASQDRSKPEHNMWGIVEVDIATKREKIIVPHDPCGLHLFWLPTVSPDGKSVMYVHNDVTSSVTGQEQDQPWSDLWVAEINGQNPQKVPGSDWFYFFDWAE